MSQEIVLIVPELTPGSGGVADYTLRLIEEWGDRVTPRFILPNETKRGLREKLPSSGGKILLQYSAYGFDRLGYPRRLLRALTDWKRESGGLLAIMFHEIWTFWPLLNKNRFVQYRHRADIGKLIAVADAIFTSTSSQAEHLRRLAPKCKPQVMPVGSNIRRSARNDGERDSALAILFGLQAARLRILRKMNTDLASLAAAKAITKIVSLGARNSEAGSVEENSLLAKLGLTRGFEVRGDAIETDISDLFGVAGFALSMQDELSITKSGTFMASAAYGLNIISPFADSLAAEPLCWLTSPGELLQGVLPNELKSRAEKLRAWQERTSSWPIIAQRFAKALQIE